MDFHCHVNVLYVSTVAKNLKWPRDPLVAHLLKKLLTQAKAASFYSEFISDDMISNLTRVTVFFNKIDKSKPKPPKFVEEANF